MSRIHATENIPIELCKGIVNSPEVGSVHCPCANLPMTLGKTGGSVSLRLLRPT
jgi:hypothetical protein